MKLEPLSWGPPSPVRCTSLSPNPFNPSPQIVSGQIIAAPINHQQTIRKQFRTKQRLIYRFQSYSGTSRDLVAVEEGGLLDRDRDVRHVIAWSEAANDDGPRG